jgi:four helix bundle protein
MKSYRDLEIFQLAKRLAVEIHEMSLQLPKFELYEEGSQIRRSSKSIGSNIVEGFARRNYKSDFLRYITIAWGECDETIFHLEMLYKTKSLIDKEQYSHFKTEYEKLSKMINKFYLAVEKDHLSKK